MTKHGRGGMAAGHRHLRVGEELRHALAELLARGNLRDPALKEISVTVSEVRVSPDLRSAVVFVVPLGGGPVDEVLEGLDRCAPYLRGQVARSVKLKFMPTLKFEADRSFDEASHIDSLLREVAQSAGPESAGDDGGRGDDGP